MSGLIIFRGCELLTGEAEQILRDHLEPTDTMVQILDLTYFPGLSVDVARIGATALNLEIFDKVGEIDISDLRKMYKRFLSMRSNAKGQPDLSLHFEEEITEEEFELTKIPFEPIGDNERKIAKGKSEELNIVFQDLAAAIKIFGELEIILAK